MNRHERRKRKAGAGLPSAESKLRASARFECYGASDEHWKKLQTLQSGLVALLGSGKPGGELMAGSGERERGRACETCERALQLLEERLRRTSRASGFLRQLAEVLRASPPEEPPR